MHVSKTNRRTMRRSIGAALVLSLITASQIALAGVAQIRGKVVIPYSTGLFSSAPDASSNAGALHAAKLAAWDLYTARFNDAKMKIYLANKEKFSGNIDDFVKNLTIIDQQADTSTHMLNVVVRA